LILANPTLNQETPSSSTNPPLGFCSDLCYLDIAGRRRYAPTLILGEAYPFYEIRIWIICTLTPKRTILFLRWIERPLLSLPKAYPDQGGGACADQGVGARPDQGVGAENYKTLMRLVFLSPYES